LTTFKKLSNLLSRSHAGERDKITALESKSSDLETPSHLDQSHPNLKYQNGGILL